MKLKIKAKYLDSTITNPFSNGLISLRFLQEKDYQRFYSVVPQFFEISTEKEVVKEKIVKKIKIKNDILDQE